MKFNLLLAKSLPLVRVSDPIALPNRDGTYTLTVTVGNDGFLPDALKQAYMVKIVKPGTATIQVADGMSVDASTPPTQEIGFFAGALLDDDATFTSLSDVTWARSRPVSWTIRGSGDVSVTVRSTRGGTSTLTVNIP